jgi:hypothetical protein
MILRLLCTFGLIVLFIQQNFAQHIYYKNPDATVIKQFRDSARRVVNIDSNSLLKKQFDYILKFYPKMLVKNIVVKYTASKSVVKTKPKFSSIFKMPNQRVYTVSFSKHTKSTLDSVLIDNLSFNSQLGLIANQVSLIEDMSTGGFFNFIAFYFRHITRNGRKRLYADAEHKTLEVGLGYQLLAYNKESEENLRIENWTNTKGYSNYVKHYRNMTMQPQMILNFISDLPIYVSKHYK